MMRSSSWRAGWRWASAFGRGWGLASVAALVGAPTALGQCHEQQKLTASDRAGGDVFGYSVSVGGHVAVVGAPQDDRPGCHNCGSAYVYRYNGTSWAVEQKLTASDADCGDYFGASVSVSGEVAVVGARYDDCAAGSDCGSAYVFRYNGSTWVQHQKLTASDAQADDKFGESLSVSGDVALVGASGDDCAAGGDCGSAYAFRFDGSSWVLEQKLVAADADAVDRFGFAVSMSGDVAIVGAGGDECGADADCGSAYVFRYNGSTWEEEQRLSASDAARLDYFGDSVSVSGTVAVVGASADNCTGALNCGSAYVFRYTGSTWVEEQKLTASDPATEDNFGAFVSVSVDLVVVGSHYGDCDAGYDCGSAYVYRYNGSTWAQKRKLTASDAGPDDYFGGSVSVSGDVAVVGASGEDCAPPFQLWSGVRVQSCTGYLRRHCPARRQRRRRSRRHTLRG